MKHPLLQNPVRWLRGAKKRHSAELYDSSAYRKEELACNPFAAILASTRLDILGKRFPIGNMIQMVVEQRDDGRKIVPVLEKPKLGTHPASYVMNRASYIDFAQKRQFLPVPLKIRQREKRLLAEIKVVEGFNGVHDELLRSEIGKLLNEKKTNEGPGMWIVPGESCSWIEWEEKAPKIHHPLVKDTEFMSYEGNQRLCLLLLKHARFRDEI